MDWSISIQNVLLLGGGVAAAMALVFGRYQEGTAIHALGQGLGKATLYALVFWSGWGCCLQLQLSGAVASVAPAIPTETVECVQAREHLQQLRIEYDQLLDELAPKKVARR